MTIAVLRRVLACLSVALSLCGCTTVGAQGGHTAAIGEFGLDLTAQDPSVAPGDDFYRYANGKWIDASQVPPDRTRWGAFDQLSVRAEEQVRAIIDALPADAPAGSAQRKVGDYYRAYLDAAAIDAAGLAPIAPTLAAIDRAATHEALLALLGDPGLDLDGPVAFGIGVDQKNPDRYVTLVGQGGLGLPDREYYLRPDASFAEIRAQYRAHVARMLGLAHSPNADGQADAILALETRIAELHWPIAKRRDRSLTYNLRDRAALDALAPAFPWTALLAPAGLDDRREFVVLEIDAVAALAAMFRDVPVPTWQSYLRYHLLHNRAAVLPKRFDEENFAFHGRTLNGQQQLRDRWKRAVTATSEALGEAVGALYVARHFPPEAKTKMLALVENLRRAYGERIRNLSWMSPATKTVALEKLASFRPKIGYPDRWRDYGALDVRPGDAFGNLVRAERFDWHRVRSRIDAPTDRDEWAMTPHTVNAYYRSVFNEIVFPAAILQPPFFDPSADDAVNYGGIGGVIGHEMGHGFDDQGAKSDANGILRTWWQPEDEVAFQQRTGDLAAQYDAYEPLAGLRVNGRLTLGENIGDLGGLSVAREAYRLSLGGREAPVLRTLTGDQRFFLSWAQVWREVIRDERLRTQVMSDPHSPARYRVNGVVRNMDAWYAAFGATPSQKLFLPPEARVRIW
ncbi:MAG: M13 family metallopeptidase [Acidobacteria bacterium]|nr:M13 family metallopeptidase [Acidobacteriota bacterium]